MIPPEVPPVPRTAHYCRKLRPRNSRKESEKPSNVYRVSHIITHKRAAEVDFSLTNQSFDGDVNALAFLVAWVGYRDCTWEPIEHLYQCSMFENYLCQYLIPTIGYVVGFNAYGDEVISFKYEPMDTENVEYLDYLRFVGPSHIDDENECLDDTYSLDVKAAGNLVVDGSPSKMDKWTASGKRIPTIDPNELLKRPRRQLRRRTIGKTVRFKASVAESKEAVRDLEPSDVDISSMDVNLSSDLSSECVSLQIDESHMSGDFFGGALTLEELMDTQEVPFDVCYM